jgi:hypothetical protein
LAYKQKLWCGLTRWLACEWYLVLLSIGLVAIGRWGNSARLCSQSCCFQQVAAALPFSCSSVWSAPPSSKLGQFSFECCPLSHKIHPGIHHLSCFGRLACCPVPTLTFCASHDLCWMLVAPLGGVGLSSHPHSQPLLLYLNLFTESSALRVWLLAPPHSPGQVQCSTPSLPAVSVGLQFTIYTFQFCCSGVQYAQGLHWIIFPGVRNLCVVHVSLFVLQIHASSFGASWWGEMVPLYSVWHSIRRLSMG